MTLRVDGLYGDVRGSYITTHRTTGDAWPWLAVYHSEAWGMSFPIGQGDTELEATRDLWRGLHPCSS